jgi:Xaa-Pro aminopeptidase
LLIATSIARTLKSPDEIAALRTAGQVTGQVIVDLLRWFRWHERMKEYEVEAYFEFRRRMLGCRDVAFSTVVGAGPNSAYLHYTKNSGPIARGDLVLIDCGAFFGHYAGDITRTFPASGRFSPDQAHVYSILLAAQKVMISEVRPGIVIEAMNLRLYQTIFGILKLLGVVPQGAAYNYRVLRFFMPHRLSHHIGTNVHDYCHHWAGEDEDAKIEDPYARSRRLAPSMVISVEPGLYFPRARLEKLKLEPPFDIINMDVAKRYSESVGGIRIEDDVLVTETGCEVLTANCPKEIQEIEALMAAADEPASVGPFSI